MVVCMLVCVHMCLRVCACVDHYCYSCVWFKIVPFLLNILNGQLPLDTTAQVDSGLCTQAIHPAKDVDGYYTASVLAVVGKGMVSISMFSRRLHTDNAGKLAHGELTHCIVPCTPRGCLELVKHTGQ